jgi:hypothetical protein
MPENLTTTWRFLFGFYKAEDAVTLAKSQGLEFTSEMEASLRSKVAQANHYVQALPDRSRIVPHTYPASPEHEAYLAALAAEPTFSETTQGMTGWAWRNIELKNLRTFQPCLNWDYVQQLIGSVPDPADKDATLRFCLPARDSMPPQRLLAGFNPTTNTFSIVTEHLDLRVVGQVQGEDPNTKRKFFGFVVGFGLPTLTVARYNGAYLLKNGYHRAAALMAKGHTTAPALVVDTDNLQMTGALGPGFFGPDTLLSPRGPVLSDFLTSGAVDISRSKLRTVVTVHAEAQQLAV